MMKGALLLTLVCFLQCESAMVVRSDEAPIVNDRPIIGVLAQEQSPMYHFTKYPEEKDTTYIGATYVKAIEASGARVVPVMIGKDRAYYEDLLGKINGVLIPGGKVSFNDSNGYADAGQHVFEIAKTFNDQGDYFPIIGICQGYKLIIVLASGRGEENYVACHSYESLPLYFVPDLQDSKMFGNMPDDIIDLFAHENVTTNTHQFCITDENLRSHNLTQDWRPTSYGDDKNGLHFIASCEHKRYPFYGIHFHPEKIFEWEPKWNYPHSEKVIKASRYVMDFFVRECRKSTHTFSCAAEEKQHLIYNYELFYSGLHGDRFEQCYLIDPRSSV